MNEITVMEKICTEQTRRDRIENAERIAKLGDKIPEMEKKLQRIVGRTYNGGVLLAIACIIVLSNAGYISQYPYSCSCKLHHFMSILLRFDCIK